MKMKRALICTKTPKTDDELKTIMASHPWAPGMIHGFYKLKDCCGTWNELATFGMTYDAIWIDAGYAYNLGHWVVESYHAPEPNQPCSRPSPGELFDEDPRRKAWWKATSDFILSNIPDEYQVYTVYYGEIVREFEDLENAWCEYLLDNFDDSSEVWLRSASPRPPTHK
ncbi:hypothetical protein [Bradyrhizobium sp. 6(2017)]|uniref:hypothetical protein n=1 Tax=Bradyrhizobium sp. 6(2017) TaxID=1197460 RepID=UPI0013E1B718|nr:hypothetical protein [Bradyrhizobium sp. 6(2017)]QIG93488.1 hypothetical protein G6P99_13885 [Bradyrhizobium sp. 6(2017)]